MHNLLRVKDLNVSYRGADAKLRDAVAGVSFEIAPGEVLGLMGESGCGKTTTALALLGLLSPEQAEVSGFVQFQGQEPLSMKQRELRALRGAGISMVFQEPEMALSPVMRAGDQVAEVIHAHKALSWKECRAEAEAALVRVGLPGTQRIYSAHPHQLSGGQRQRVVLAQALACEPALIIADEPTASLDARSQKDLLALLRQLNRTMGIAILLISHTPEVQAYLADRLMVMAGGRIVEQGRFEDLYRHANHALTKKMLRTSLPAKIAEELDLEMVT
ncbi:MAG: ABC transporter ATP-binding protein [Candidatus Acidiferrales bacterium]